MMFYFRTFNLEVLTNKIYQIKFQKLDNQHLGAIFDVDYIM